jgi:hypothetical protein
MLVGGLQRHYIARYVKLMACPDDEPESFSMHKVF